MKWSLTCRKATASAVNITVVSTITSPIYFLSGIDVWRIVCTLAFFLYALLLPHRCLGQMIANTYQSQPTNLAFAALYTLGFMTVIYWIWFPFDLMLANGLFVQMPSLMLFGNTLHGLATGRQTMTEQEHLFECIALKGECPDCGRSTSLVRSNSYVHCRFCRTTFFATELTVQRVQS